MALYTFRGVRGYGFRWWTLAALTWRIGGGYPLITLEVRRKVHRVHFSREGCGTSKGVQYVHWQTVANMPEALLLFQKPWTCCPICLRLFFVPKALDLFS